jgi:alcohol dehydrogenase class IV
MTVKANWNYPTAVKFGVGRVTELADHCRALGIHKPLLVTDAGLASLPMTQSVLADLQSAGLGAALFADIRPNPVGANVEAGLAVYRAGGHDGVVAFGGGSGLDIGKLIAFMSGQTRPIWDFEDIGDWWTRADPTGIAPIIAVPTTAGTGSEVGRAAVVTDESNHTKKIIFHPKIMPSVVICDPALSVGMPPKITAGTGMDALSHCLEAYCAPGFHPLADGVAVEGIRLIASALPRVMQDPNDLDARADMMAAAAMGATAFQKGLGGMHALAHPIGALFR